MVGTSFLNCYEAFLIFENIKLAFFNTLAAGERCVIQFMDDVMRPARYICHRYRIRDAAERTSAIVISSDAIQTNQLIAFVTFSGVIE